MGYVARLTFAAGNSRWGETAITGDEGNLGRRVEAHGEVAPAGLFALAVL